MRPASACCKPGLRGRGQRPGLGGPWIIVLGPAAIYDLADLDGDESAPPPQRALRRRSRQDDERPLPLRRTVAHAG